MITMNKGLIASHITKQSMTESEAPNAITEHSLMSVLLFQLRLIIKTFGNFVEILCAY